jgi:hypothetical protein
LEDIELLYLTLLDYFHCVLLVVGFILGQNNIAESSPSQVLQILVVLGAVLGDRDLLFWEEVGL